MRRCRLQVYLRRANALRYVSARDCSRLGVRPGTCHLQRQRGGTRTMCCTHCLKPRSYIPCRRFRGKHQVLCSAAPRPNCDYTGSPPVLSNRAWFGDDRFELIGTAAELAERAVTEALRTRPPPTTLSMPRSITCESWHGRNLCPLPSIVTIGIIGLRLIAAVGHTERHFLKRCGFKHTRFARTSVQSLSYGLFYLQPARRPAGSLEPQ
jgi:hypothetical protein